MSGLCSASNRILLNCIRFGWNEARTLTTVGKTTGPGATYTPPASSTSAAAGIKADVPGLSSRIVKPATGPVGPGAAANADYKVPEYYCYDKMSYHEAEIELAKYRCPQPSAIRK